MTAALPDYYFRLRENGALVFRVDPETRHRRIEMDPIATVNVRKGEIRPQGDRTLSEADLDTIRAWIEARRATLAAREIDDISRTVEHLNHAAQWAQSRASDDQLEEVTGALLMAMHDLRTILVRKQADRLGGGD